MAQPPTLVLPAPLPSAAPATVTEDDIAQFLLAHPGFFERHADVLAQIRLVSPMGDRVVSLHERQVQRLREQQQQLGQQAAEMAQRGSENGDIAARLHQWSCRLLALEALASRPDALLQSLCEAFALPPGVLRLWGVSPVWADLACAQPVPPECQRWIESLPRPCCGPCPVGPLVDWPWPEAERSAWGSVAVLPLRRGPTDAASGVLVLASPEGLRFQPQMGTLFLERIAELAAATLAPLYPPAAG
jgi:uncharacterized protein